MQITALSAEAERKKGEIESLRKDLTSYLQKSANLEQKLKEVEERQQKAIAAAISRATEDQTQEYLTEKEKLKKSHLMEIKKLQSDNEELKKQLGERNAEKDSVSKNSSELKEKVSVLQDEISKLKSSSELQKGQQEAKLSELAKNKDTAIEQLNLKIVTLGEQIEEEKEKVEDLVNAEKMRSANEIAELKKKEAELTKRLSDMELDIKGKIESIQELNRSVVESAGQREKLEKEIGEIKKENDTLNKQISMAISKLQSALIEQEITVHDGDILSLIDRLLDVIAMQSENRRQLKLDSGADRGSQKEPEKIIEHLSFEEPDIKAELVVDNEEKNIEEAPKQIVSQDSRGELEQMQNILAGEIKKEDMISPAAEQQQELTCDATPADIDYIPAAKEVLINLLQEFGKTDFTQEKLGLQELMGEVLQHYAARLEELKNTFSGNKPEIATIKAELEEVTEKYRAALAENEKKDKNLNDLNNDFMKKLEKFQAIDDAKDEFMQLISTFPYPSEHEEKIKSICISLGITEGEVGNIIKMRSQLGRSSAGSSTGRKK